MNDKAELPLLHQALEMVALAKTKGFDWSLSIQPFMWEHWMPFQDVFCNQACAVVTWWLRERHKLLVWIEPIDNFCYQGFIRFFGLHMNTPPPQDPKSYEHVMLAAITEALNALPTT